MEDAPRIITFADLVIHCMVAAVAEDYATPTTETHDAYITEEIADNSIGMQVTQIYWIHYLGRTDLYHIGHKLHGNSYLQTREADR